MQNAQHTWFVDSCSLLSYTTGEKIHPHAYSSKPNSILKQTKGN